MAAISAFHGKHLTGQGWRMDEAQRFGERVEIKGQKGKRMVVVSTLDKGSDRTVSITQPNLWNGFASTS